VTAVVEPQIGQLAELDLPQAAIQEMTIHQLLVEARRMIGAIGKNARNSEQNYNYRGVDDVVNAAAPVFNRLGILGPMPIASSAGYRDVRTSRDKPAREVTVQVTYRFTGLPLGDHLDIVVPGESMDMGDKGTPKAMSVALRIALLQALLIPTEDLHPDPDSQSYERGDTASGAADRQSRESSRDELLETVTTLATELRETLGVNEYDFNEWLVGVCQKDFGVDIASSRIDDGPVESIDFGKLRTKQLQLAWTRLKRKLAQEKLAREGGA